MTRRNLLFSAQIDGRPETIFDLVADMPNYSRWLPNSAVFGGTIDVSPYPVRLGTTYLDAGPVEKPGTVTEFDRPRSLGFHHTVIIRKRLLKTDIDAQIRYVFEPRDGGTLVLRTLLLTMNLRGVVRFASPLIVDSFRRENVRMMKKLKCYVEAQRQQNPTD